MTSYALLAALKYYSDIDEAAAIVQWITRQRNAYGGFSSTQVDLNVFKRNTDSIMCTAVRSLVSVSHKQNIYEVVRMFNN